MQIVLLDHTDPGEARRIHALLAGAYRREARLIGADDFPPLYRLAGDIRSARSEFLGAIDAGALLAVIELESLPPGDGLLIASLGVAGDQLGRGHARRLVKATLARSPGTVRVATAEANLPALRLYASEGFKPVGREVTPEGIRRIRLLRETQG